MQAFDYVRASSVDEVVSLLAQNGDQARVLSGGTDLLVALREGRRQAKLVIDVKGLPETSQVEYSPQDGLKFGASVPCYRLYNNKEIAAAYPGLMDSARLIGGVQFRAAQASAATCAMHRQQRTLSHRSLPTERPVSLPGPTARVNSPLKSSVWHQVAMRCKTASSWCRSSYRQ